ncbi:mandelate racemase/muconate lactonizing enzyme family protein [Fuerstiella marisgermanici]|uniref:D-galactonate dehydratase n=1 Tax=Fuerstiella marisgermanici TaxID=1891926 RepID=A0A1P8WEY2_9PLAN|nr:mandelate racemase/muconate lactonizing enzyme family protein [Fuerstiella marisgermanici]APZ92587.1 D-galactonate dehydratase [Fuerstiella marisgermanici]
MPKITAIETSIPSGIMTNLLLVRIHTDDGLIGCGETYYTPQTIEALIHDWMAERLIGAEATDIEAHWRFLYERCTAFGFPGAEMRALSAIDVALWDILGQVCGQPVWQLLGGAAQKKVRIYNTCGGPGYGTQKQSREETATHPGWPGYGDEGIAGPLQDNWSSIHAAGDLAQELVDEGICGMKMWPFDRYAHAGGGAFLSAADIEAGMKPLREIRDRVGNQIEIMIEGHAFFPLASALRLADALAEIKPFWLEDVVRVDNIDTLADFRQRSGLPIAATEMLLGRSSYLSLLQAKAADYVMIDPTWAGGISETRRIIDLAQTFNISATMHDCTGPLTLFSGLHCSVASTNVVLQETVRAHIRTFSEHLIDRPPIIENGFLMPPTDPGLGTALLPELFQPGTNSYRCTGKTSA